MPVTRIKQHYELVAEEEQHKTLHRRYMRNQAVGLVLIAAVTAGWWLWHTNPAWIFPTGWWRL